MKILKLKFKNLNSLKGEWEIDFEKLATDGIFAITGATGSGKSTILDAITLALYGKTPRHNKISESINEIMNKSSGECFAEVIFKGKEERLYLSRFEQHRASKRASGRLQKPKVLLEELGKRAITTKKNEWDREIERVTGLDFERFIRSILLAQGNFALFLKSDEKKKGEILEQITGTTIYKTISRRVFELNREREFELERLKSSKNLELLSEKELRELEKRRVDNQKSIQTIKSKLSKNQQLLNSFNSLREKQKALRESLSELERAKEALDSKEYKKYEFAFNSIPKAKILYSKLQEIEDKKELQKELNSKIKSTKERLQKNREELKIKTEKRKKLNEELETFNSTFEQKVKFIESREKEIKIERELKEIEPPLKRAVESFESISKEIETIEKILKYPVEEILDLEREIETLKREQIEKDKRVESAKVKLKDTRLKRETLIKKRDFLKKIKTIELSIKFLRLKEIEDEWERKNRVLDSLIEKEAELSEIASLKSLEYLRANLKDNTPCPLCGSLHHPWRDREFELDFELLQSTQIEISKIKESLSELDIRKKSLQSELKDKEIESIDKTLEELESKLKEIKESLNSEDEKLLLDGDSLEIELGRVEGELRGIDTQEIEKEIREKEDEQRELNEKLETLKSRLSKQMDELGLSESKIKEIKAQKESLKRGIKDIANLRDKKDSLLKKRTTLETKRGHLEGELRELQKIQDRLKSEILELGGSVEVESLEALKKKKETLDGNLQEIDKEINSLNREIDKDEYRLKDRDSQLESISKEIQKREEEFDKEFKASDIKSLETLKKFATISEKERQNIESWLNSTKSNYTDAKSRFLNLEGEVLKLKGELISFDENLLKSESVSLEREINKLLQEIGEINSQLNRNQDLLKKYQDSIKELKRVEKEKRVLEKLNELIGQADGSKFSKFAQTLTMEYLLLFANAHLAKLNPRYKIAQKDSSGERDFLKLVIVDTYQANTTRGVETLSGGESFLVSLALALGLSDLAGERIKVETLFLDEGFGTLDSNTLESVLDTLDRLRAEDKMIGVISHIEAIKERIPTQIRVKLGSGGVGYLDDKFRVK